jgi:hypothetical protein
LKKYGIPAAVLCAAMSITASADDLWDWPAFSTPEETVCRISCEQGAPAEFSSRGLEILLGLESGELSGITVTGLPENGKLLLEGVPVPEFSHLDREELDELCLMPEEDALSASFSFLPDTREAVPATVEVQVLEKLGAVPLSADASLATFSDTAAWKYLPASSPDGGEIRIRITCPPRYGSVSVEGQTVCYRPYPGFSGEDSFSYAACSPEGVFSDEARVQVVVEPNESGIRFADMNEAPETCSAIRLHQKGVLCGEQVGQHWFFYPERSMTRGEFLIALLAASGLDDELAACVNTQLQNDGEIPLWAKSYLRKALETGIVKEDVFPWDETLTRAEAVVFVHRASGIDDVKSYRLALSDKDEIPAWAAYSYQNLAAHQLLTLYSGSARPGSTLTRADAAELLWPLCQYRMEN